MSLNKQEAFDKAYQAFVVEMQPKASVEDEDEVCMYRTEDGLACHVGLLLPDRLYSPELEGKVPTSDEFDEVAKELGWSEDDREWLETFQELHDDLIFDNQTRDEREEYYRSFAKHHELKVPGDSE